MLTGFPSIWAPRHTHILARLLAEKLSAALQLSDVDSPEKPPFSTPLVRRRMGLRPRCARLTPMWVSGLPLRDKTLSVVVLAVRWDRSVLTSYRLVC